MQIFYTSTHTTELSPILYDINAVSSIKIANLKGWPLTIDHSPDDHDKHTLLRARDGMSPVLSFLYADYSFAYNCLFSHAWSDTLIDVLY